MADIVLLQPRIGDWDDFRSHPSLPLSLLSASRLVSKEFDTVLIDTRVQNDWKPRLRSELDKNPLCVGITSMTGRQIGHALEISNYVKEISNVPVVWGGIHASLLPESTLENPSIDILVIGEGEVSFLELAMALAAKAPLKGIAGISYKEKGAIIKNHKRSFAKLDDLPDLPLSLIDLDKFLPIFKGRRTFYMETSRGCPNRCGFCYNANYNNNSWRAFSADMVIAELKYLCGRFKTGSFYIVDDNFFVDLKRARSIAEGIIKEGLDIYWEVQGITINSALKMDDDYLELLVRAGMKKVHFGIESASKNVLKLINKNLNIDNVIEVNKKWGKHDIIVQYNFMCGFPGESIADIRQTIDLVFQLMRENPNALISPLCPYTPYPGTALYDQSLKDGFIVKRKLEDWQEANYGDNLWESPERKRLISSLFFASMFLDEHRSKDMVDSKVVKALIGLYRPLAKFRIRHLFFDFMPELKIKKILLG